MTWSVAALALAAVGAGVVAIATEDPEPATVSIDCAVYDADHSVRLTFRGEVTEDEADSGCAELAANLSGSGSYWKVGAPSLPESEPELVCAVSDPEAAANAILIEIPSDSFFTNTATSICGELVSKDWTEVAGQVSGPWQEEWLSAARQEEAIEAEEEDAAAEERFHEEQRNAAIERCERRAAADEEAEVRRIERETGERVEAAPSESAEYAAEEEGWEHEEEASERGEEAVETCKEE